MGNSFAVSATCWGTDYEVYRPFTNNESHGHCWASASGQPQNYIIYNPIPLKITKLRVRNRVAGSYAIAAPRTGIVKISNDNENWIDIQEWTNDATGAGVWWEVILDTGFNKLYNFYTLTHDQGNSYECIQAFELIATCNINSNVMVV